MKKLIILLFLFATYLMYGQNDFIHNPNNFTLEIKKATEKIKLDGILNEAPWVNNFSRTKKFWKKFPTNDTLAFNETEIMLTYDDKFIYVAAKLYDATNKYLLTSLKRDQGLRNGDGFAVLLDPFNQKNNGFFFGLTPYNTQSEDLLSAADDDIDFTWDNTWFSETKVYDGYWIAEIAIPFSILRFDPIKTTWGINFLRSDRKRNEFHTWTRIPIQFRGLDMGYFGLLKWDNPPPKSTSKISVSPYSLMSASTTKTEPKPKLGFNAGFDSKVAISPSMNLDLTVNPDFSQVDVDRQVTNLTRFNVFFPERRNFFLENSDLFSFGIPPIRPFYSRRFGSKKGTSVPILFGARLSGNLAKKTRVGLMNITTAAKDKISGDNFTALSVNQRVLKRSSITAYAMNRADLNNGNASPIKREEKYSRNLGYELSYTDNQGKWNGWFTQHISLKPFVKNDFQYFEFGGQYQGTNFSFLIDANRIGTNYFVDMGFESVTENYDAVRDTTIKLGSKFIYNEIKYTWYPTGKFKFNNLSVEMENFYQYTLDSKAYEKSNELKFNFTSANNFGFRMSYDMNTSYLRFPFKFVNDPNASPLPAATYQYNTFSVNLNTDRRKNFFVEAGLSVGKFYNANYNRFTTGITFRQQPRLSFVLNAELNKLNFPTPYGKQNLFLLAPQFEYNFSNKIFWTTFFQLNTQNNNININSRLQYRYRPMSDLFIVYTDNYFSSPLFNNKNRAMVIKFNRWLNL